MLVYLYSTTLKNISTSHPSYIQDSPDFLRAIEEVNQGPKLEDNVMLMTMDATGLYDNIPYEDGLECIKWKKGSNYTKKFYPKNDGSRSRMEPIYIP